MENLIKKNSFLKDVSLVGFSKFFIILFGLGTSIIIARILGPEKNGLIASLYVYPAIFISIGSLGIRQSATYFLGKDIYSEFDIRIAISQIWIISTILSVVISLILIISFVDYKNNFYLVILSVLPIPFSLFNTYSSGIFLGKNEIKKFNKINWIPSLVTFLLSFILILVFNFDVEGFLIATVGGALITFILLLFKNKFIKSFSLIIKWNIIINLLKLGLIYAFALFVINLNYRIDIILLSNLSNSFETGIYSKGAGVAQYLWQIPMLLSTIVFARSSVSQNNKKFSLKVIQLLRVSLIIVSFVSIIMIIFSNQFILILFGKDFFNSISVLNYLIPGVVLLTIFKVMNTDLAGRGKPWISLKAMIPALIVNVLLNLLFIPKYGADGAALSSTISYSVAAILFLHFYSKTVQIKIKEILKFKYSDFDPILGLFKKHI